MEKVLPWYHGLQIVHETTIEPERGRTEKEDGHHKVEFSEALLFPPWGHGVHTRRVLGNVIRRDCLDMVMRGDLCVRGGHIIGNK